MSDTVLEIAAVPRLVRLRAMGRLGVRMMFHDRLKFIGTISGVVFAVLLAVQQLSILFAQRKIYFCSFFTTNQLNCICNYKAC